MEEESDCRPEALVKFVNNEPSWSKMLRGVEQQHDPVHERYFNAFVQCSDGHVPFHHVVLSSVSQELDAQMSEHVKHYGQPTPINPLWFITPGVKMHHMRIVVSILYNGKARLYSMEEREQVEKAMEALLINPKRFYLDWVDEETESNPNSFPLVPVWKMGQQIKAEADKLPEQKVVVKKRKKWMRRRPRVLCGGVKTRARSKARGAEVRAVEASSVEIKRGVKTAEATQSLVKIVKLKECQLVVEKLVERKPEVCEQTRNRAKSIKGRKNNLIPKVKRKLRNSGNPDSENTLEKATPPKKKAKRAIIPPQVGRRTTKRTPVLSTSLSLKASKGVGRPRKLPTISATRVTSSVGKISKKKLGRPRKTGDTGVLRKTTLANSSICKPHKSSGRLKKVLRSSPLKKPPTSTHSPEGDKKSDVFPALLSTLSLPSTSSELGLMSPNAPTVSHTKKPTQLPVPKAAAEELPLNSSPKRGRPRKLHNFRPAASRADEGSSNSSTNKSEDCSAPKSGKEQPLTAASGFVPPLIQKPSERHSQVPFLTSAADEVLSDPSPKRGRLRKIRNFNQASAQVRKEITTSSTTARGAFPTSKAVAEPLPTPAIVAIPPTLQTPPSLESIEPQIVSESLSTSNSADCKTKYLFPMILPTTLTPLPTSPEAPLTSPPPEKFSVATSSLSSPTAAKATVTPNVFKICLQVTPQMNPLAKRKVLHDPL